MVFFFHLLCILISIHASRGGCDRVKVLLVEKNAEFQSTLPAREATSVGISTSTIALFQSTLPAGEATLGIESEELTEVISIHASREGSDKEGLIQVLVITISIHASREGSDLKITGREEYAMLFQSTFPAGEATTTSARSEDVPPISIHASREGSDLRRPYYYLGPAYFNPRFPRGKRRSHGRS